MITRPLVLLALSLFFPLLIHGEGKTYTYSDLVDRMTNMEKLAELPAPGEKTSLASSYDRKSQYDSATDKYIEWNANGDGNGVIRHEGDVDVLMDVHGPGCIWRTWSATAADGHVKIYLDGSETPAVDLPFKSYFDGKTAPFNRPNLVYDLSPGCRGFDNYTPIPFQKSCKIVAEKDWGGYYQFTYTQFPAGTVVPTFSLALSKTDAAALDRANQILGKCGEVPDRATGAATETKDITVAPGATTTVVDLAGPQAITDLEVKLSLPSDAEAQRVLLRQLTISITWDDEKSPAVWSPLGDFFAYVGGADTFSSLPVGLRPDGTFYSTWYMPFGTRAHLVVTNDGPASVDMTWRVSHAPLSEPISDLARFHAKWHRDAFLPTRADRAPDWTLLTTQGRGRYVGTHLHGWNPRGAWWGEGDDKFFIDGEKFPSSFGTGSEDYFGYAWSQFTHFSRPYHNQILNEHNEGHIDDNRWHIPDSVPFQTSFEGDIEKYFANDRGTLFAAEVFWYLDAAGVDPYEPVPVGDRIHYWVQPVVYREPGVLEGEKLHHLGPPWPWTDVEDMFRIAKTWSNDQQLLWRPTPNCPVLTLDLPWQKGGKFRLLGRFTKSDHYGIFQINFNGVDLGEPIDLFASATAPADPIDFGVVTLPDGKPIFKAKPTGKNTASQGDFFGLDYLKLVPAP